ncbi:MAG: superinfection immunity protein [Deltaproteobacteria bacterium]|jgi:hypothetical protein|nr:superinfection immunity protein [Deltaproteobacteria bacterium]
MIATVLVVIGIVIGVAIALVIYLIPTIIAFKRGHRNRVPILLVNILLGWVYGIAWIAALIWSFTDNTE